MATKFHVSKTNAIGETLVAEVEVEGSDVTSIQAALRPVLQVLDDRMLEMNMRIAGAQKAIRELPADVAIRVHNCIEMLYGMAPIPAEVQNALAKQAEDSATTASQRERYGFTVIDGGKEPA